MKKIILDLDTVVEKYYSLLRDADEFDFSRKRAVDKWSYKEELGHLIDSAQNNIQRFIRVQYEEDVHIRYNPDNWVTFNDYQNTEKKEIVELWYLLNKRIISVLQKMPATKYETLMSFDKDPSIKNTTLFIAEDYIKHMIHHLENITR